MNPEIEKDLLEKYPQLFRQFEGFSCGNGWALIIDALCSLLNGDSCPSIKSIVEKYGIMRCEIEGASDLQMGYVKFAETMSRRTCEECGAPGATRGGEGYWLTTVCTKHAPVGSEIL